MQERKSAQAALEGVPISYGENRLALMARDPEWLFAYWEIRPETVQRAMHDVEDSVPVLRVSYRKTDTLFERSYDERVDLYARRHYLHVPEARHVYRVELGFRSRDGHFVAALRSNEVLTPDMLGEMDEFAAQLAASDPSI